MIIYKQMRKLLLLLFFLSVSHSTTSQNNIFRHITQRDGLPTGYIYSIIQDHNGFVWIATNEGISSYDGITITNFLPDNSNPNSITGNGAYEILQYDKETLLIASYSGLEILNLKTNHIRLVAFPEDMPQPNVAYDIEILNTKEIYIATDVGLYYFPDLPNESNDVNPTLFPYEIEVNDVGNILRINLTYDNDETLWVSTGTKLLHFNIHSKSIETIDILNEKVQSLLNSNVWEIYIIQNGDVLMSTVHGLILWKKNEQQPKVLESIGNYSTQEMREAGFQSITDGKNGAILLGTARLGGLIWNPVDNSVVRINHQETNSNSIRSDDVHYAFIDNQDNTWFGHHNVGISLMYSNTFNYSYHLINESASKLDTANITLNFYEDESENLWFTTPVGLIKKSKNGATEKFVTGSKEKFADLFFGVYKLDDQRLLVLRDSLRTFYAFDTIKEEFEKLSPDSLRTALNFNLAENNSNYFLGALDGRVIKINKTDYSISYLDIPYPEDYKLPIKPVMPYSLDDTRLAIFSVKLKLSAPPVFDVYIYNTESKELELLELDYENFRAFGVPTKSTFENGVFWMKLENGLLKLNIETGNYDLLFQNDVSVLNMSNFLVNILEDEEGFIWIADEAAILKLDPLTESITFYDLEIDKQLSSVQTGKILRNGNIIFAGNGGYIEFNPKDLQSEGLIQNVHITEVISNNNNYNALYTDSILELDESENNLSISFLGINYRDPSSTRYRYRMKGYTDDWIDIESQQQVFLANIPSGNYTFEVQAAPRFGAYSTSTASIDFKIPPPWWRTWPAYLAYAIILICSLIAFDRFQRQRVIAKERERTREKELKQAKEIEVAYENLKATQKKLIQSEKMASLGELTAGIAHEIQNPLNFVNNFAEINQELAQELNEELAKGDIEEARALAKDIVQNEIKILHHGKRADSIVKGMLQHSRNNSGEKEWTDINVLCDEYLRLAYHGLRAKDKTFNATLETDFDKDLEKALVVPQDIGRVILNIINNALHAIKSKQQTKNDGNYIPTVWVGTEQKVESILIRIKDNGNGIPEEVRDKIFQPFFTTKSAGEGTGLGLSMSYDIIRAHGGELNLDSKTGEYTVFEVNIPTHTKN